MQSKRTILNQRDLDSMRRPLDQAIPPPGCYYTSKELYDLEVERIFLKEWLWVGTVDQVRRPGDYFALNIVNEPIVVLRGRSGELRAFSAVCRHRGAIVATGEGNCRAFTCPYHMWTYSLEGKLIGAPEMKGVKDFDTSRYGLPIVKVETWGGLIFVNFDPSSKPLTASLGDLTEYVKNYKMGELIRTERRTYDIHCNWKSLVENSMEAYHNLGTHHTSTGTEYGSLDCWDFQEEPHGAYELITCRLAEPATVNVPGSIGQPAFMIEGLTPQEQKRHSFVFLYPDLLLVFLPDMVLSFVMHPDGPDHVKYVVDWLFPKQLVDKPDFAEIAQRAYDGADLYNQQDKYVLGLTHQGYQSRLFQPGRFSLHEPVPHRIVQWILNRTQDGNASPETALVQP